MLGLGVSGVAAARLAAARGAAVYASDVALTEPQSAAAEELRAEGIDAEGIVSGMLADEERSCLGCDGLAVATAASATGISPPVTIPLVAPSTTVIAARNNG